MAMMDWKPESLEFVHTCATDSSADFHATVDGLEYTVKHKTSIEILGGMISTDNPVRAQVEHRLRRGTSCFWSLILFLLCKVVSLKLRFKEYVKRVQPIILYGSGSWTWCRTTLNRLISWENNHLRRIVGARMRPQELYSQFIQRTTHWARRFFHQEGHVSLSTSVLQRIYQLSGRAFAALC